MQRRWLLILCAGLALTGCSKPEDTVTGPNPDNAVTRYGENLAGSEQRAQEAADKANAAIARNQQEMNQGMQQGQ